MYFFFFVPLAFESMSISQIAINKCSKLAIDMLTKSDFNKRLLVQSCLGVNEYTPIVLHTSIYY